MKSPGARRVPGDLPLRRRRPLQRPERQGPALSGRLRRADQRHGQAYAAGGRSWRCSWPGFIFFQFFDNIQSAKAINAAAAGLTAGRGRPWARPRS
ncbi:MAG: hypothetical protein M0C28_33065 [Candidatus Moduliflexus flocculans]|nr:hypothetical protein [Candidatus Moduliflexus flocculans]